MGFNADDRMDREYEMVPMPTYFPMGMPVFPQMMRMPNMMYMDTMMEDPYLDYDYMEDFEDEIYSEDDKSRKKKSYRPNKAKKIMRKIDRYNPGIYRYMSMYGMPYPACRALCRRIVGLSLMYYDD